MPKITIPYSATVGADQTPTEEVNQSFFSAVPAVEDQDSGAVLNGSLQEDNLAGNVTHLDFKRGAYSQAGAMGATDNQDYFPDIFPDGTFITENPVVPAGKPHLAFPNQTNLFQPIPGLNQTFYNPYKKALAIFTWNLSLAVDGWVDKSIATTYGTESEENKYGAWVIFKMTKPDGVEVVRGVNEAETAFRTVLPKVDKPVSGARRGAQNDLYYSGHMTLELDGEGWYTAGLHLGMAGTQKVQASSLGDDSIPLWIFALEDAGMNTAQQSPTDYTVQSVDLDEDFTIWGEGIRQARVRVRSIRHVLFRL